MKVLALGLALALAACSGGSRDATGPDPAPPVQDPLPPGPDPAPPAPDPEPPAPAPQPGVQGIYVPAQINQSTPGQLVTIANPDGLVIGLYRFEATTMSMDPLQTFALSLSYTDDKTQFTLDDAGEFKQAGPISQDGALPLRFYSDVYGDQFTGVVLNGFAAIRYDFVTGTSSDLSLSGLAAGASGGVQFFVSPSLALDGGVSLGVGKMGNVKVDGQKEDWGTPDNTTTTRLRFGANWYP